MRVAYFTAVSVLCLAAPPAVAQPSPACKPVVDALHKQWTTPNHVTIVQAGQPGQTEAITIGDATYTKASGNWMKSPVSFADTRRDEDAKLQNAKVYTCRSMPGASVNGVAADVYAVHTLTDDITGDLQIWIARATGLPIKMESDTTVGGDKWHFSSTWDYANIHAPVVK